MTTNTGQGRQLYQCSSAVHVSSCSVLDVLGDLNCKINFVSTKKTRNEMSLFVPSEGVSSTLLSQCDSTDNCLSRVLRTFVNMDRPEHHCIDRCGSTYNCLSRGLRNFLNMDRPEHHSIDRCGSTYNCLSRGLRNSLNMDRPKHHSIDRPKERGVEKGSGRHSTLQSRERSVFNQTNVGTALRATFGETAESGTERVWGFPRATTPS